MDVATRLQPRTRAEAYSLERERAAMPEDSSTESESRARRKIPRTSTENEQPGEITFRKPSLPASATRVPVDSRQSFSQRRRSTVREHTRVPSGPREFPSPGKSRIASGSFTSIPSATSDSSSMTRTHTLNSSTSQPFFGKGGDPSRSSIARTSSNDAAASMTPVNRSIEQFEFIPAVNFDDFQNSIASYDGPGPLLTDFPAIGGRRSLLGDADNNIMAERDRPIAKQTLPQPTSGQEQSVRRSHSLRRRLSAVPGVKQIANLVPEDNAMGSHTGSGLSLRTRRQSAAPRAPSPAGPAPPPVGAGSRQPRKSLGPGILSSMMEGRKTSQPLPSSHTDSILKPALARTGSLNKTSRRTTMQPSISSGNELPRLSTLTATTQSRANKVKSLQPPPREPDVNTPNNRPSTKGSIVNRAHTPSSSGNRRQSTISGRASGLGARTISPTDARRLQRLSMMQAPPMPTNGANAPSTPQEELPPLKIELPRYAQASPGLAPRKSYEVAPVPGRTSPEMRQPMTNAPSLNSKTSMQSLLNSSIPTSRLPTPKQRSTHSNSAQYSEEEEIVPPVPAIPKAFESPRESETPQHYRGKSSQGGSLLEPVLTDFDGENSFPATPAKPYKSIADFTPDSRRKVSSDLSRMHLRKSTSETLDKIVGPSAAHKTVRAPADETGRKNNNLQPLRLPPLNLGPINTTATRGATLPRPSQELERRNESASMNTPEPKRTAKTPSTPMTASKATFFRRQDEENAKQGPVRSSTSHFALRELIQLDDNTMKFFDDTDLDFLNGGVQIPGAAQRNAITPFASGSLPKTTEDFSKLRGSASGELSDGFSSSRYDSSQLPNARAQPPPLARTATTNSFKSADLPTATNSPSADSSHSDSKKEVNGTTSRRKLSLGWRRSSSKNANHADHKASASHDAFVLDDKAKAQRRISEMPPPKLPASATWVGDAPALPRPSLDSIHRKSTAASLTTLSTVTSHTDADSITSSTPKTNGQRIAQPGAAPNPNRSSSWGNIMPGSRSNAKPASSSLKPRHGLTASTISAIVKDKDDLAADDEMRRLSQKRRDVDTAARETEDLKRRAVARTPMTPEQVLQDRNYSLNIFERGEIMDFQKEGIFFTGTKTARKVIGSLAPTPQVSSDDKNSKAGNYGYDDERGDYNIVLGDHLAYRYEVVDVLGKGSFGQVVRCVDHKAGGIVAVKIIRNKKRFHQQALVEVGILSRLRDWDPEGTHATLSITSSFYFRSHLCIVTPCLSINLYELIRAHNFVGFSLPLIRRFGRQMLACLVLLQNKRIIHCDLKPENILLYEARKADIRVIDFGSSCKEEEKVYTYIQSRFYRSPEVILGSTYGLGIDMWSFGCILAELWTGYPIFPGENEQEQLACIMEIFGPPDRHLVERCTRKKLFFDSVGKPRVTVSSKGRRRRPSSKTLAQALKTEDEAFLDFVTRCLRWDPDRRMKPHEAVTHPFITNQPMSQRQGIPDEARRAARARTTATGHPSAPGPNPSPVKRNITTSGALPMSSHGANNAAHSSSSVQQTPHKGGRGVPDTPQTSLRNPATTASILPTANPNARTTQISPTKQSLGGGGNRRHSTLGSGNTAANGFVAGSKRTSNGAVIGVSGAAAYNNNNGGGLPTIASQHSTASIASVSSRHPSSSNVSSAATSSTNLTNNASTPAAAAAAAASNLAAIAARESISNAGRWRG